MPKVLVTGGAGFIGAHLVDRLVQQGDEVVVLDNLKRGRRGRLDAHLRSGQARLVEDDIRRFGTAIDALLFAGRHGLPAPVNIGSGAGTKILDLAARVLEVTRSKSGIGRRPRREVEVAKFVADTTLMRSLGLSPETDPLQHLAEIVTDYAPARG